MSIPLPDDQLVLDFVNTRTRDSDLLATREAAADWWAGCSGAPSPTSFSERDVTELRELRTQVGELFDEQAPSAVRRIDELLAELRLVPRLGDDSTITLQLDLADASPVDAVSHQVLASLLSLSEGAGLRSVRSCAAADCVIRFSSPNARRRWCSSGGCGNRERVRRHYRRRRETS